LNLETIVKSCKKACAFAERFTYEIVIKKPDEKDELKLRVGLVTKAQDYSGKLFGLVTDAWMGTPWEFGVYNYAQSCSEVFQLGVVNDAMECADLQIGLVNRVKKATGGLQFGVVCYGRRARFSSSATAQIGLFCVAKGKGTYDQLGLITVRLGDSWRDTRITPFYGRKNWEDSE